MPKGWWRRFRLVIVAPVLLAVALGSWAVSSPVGSSPDEDFHVASVWCGLGDRPGLCEPGRTAAERLVPAALTHAGCFRFNPNASGTCAGLNDQAMTPTKRVNTTHSYPPVFYAVMGLFAGHDVVRSVLVMRLVNLLIFVGLGLALYALLPPPRRRAFVLSWAVTLIPVSAFLIASINPSSWTIIGCGISWMAALAFFESTGRRRIGLAIVALIGIAMACGSRADGAVYAAFGVAVAALVVLGLGRRLWRPRTVWLPVVAFVLAIVTFATARQSAMTVHGASSVAAPQPDGGASTSGQTTLSGFSLLFHNVLDLPQLWTGAISGPLGWLDTPMPVIVGAVGVFAFGGVLFFGLHTMDRRKAAALTLVAAALVAIPLYVLQISHDRVGQDVQPRYMLPLLILLAGVALLGVRGEDVPFNRAQRIVLIVLLAVSNSAALYSNLARYVHSPSNLGFDLNHGLGWWWTAHVPSPMVIWALGSVAFAIALATAVLWTPTVPLPADDDDAPAGGRGQTTQELLAA